MPVKGVRLAVECGVQCGVMQVKETHLGADSGGTPVTARGARQEGRQGSWPLCP